MPGCRCRCGLQMQVRVADAGAGLKMQMQVDDVRVGWAAGRVGRWQKGIS